MEGDDGDGMDPGEEPALREEPGLREVSEVQVEPESSSLELAFSAWSWIKQWILNQFDRRPYLDPV